MFLKRDQSGKRPAFRTEVRRGIPDVIRRKAMICTEEGDESVPRSGLYSWIKS